MPELIPARVFYGLRGPTSDRTSVAGPKGWYVLSAGYYKRRRGILEHIEAGSIDLLESGIHDFLLLKANLLIGSDCSIPPGVCFTSAPAIHAHCRRVSERTIQRCLEHLEEIDLIKTWKVPGKRGNFPVLVCRGSVHDLSGKEYRVNGAKTTDWRQPICEPVGEVSGRLSTSVGSLSGYRKKRVEKEKKEKQAAAPPADSRYQPFVDFAFESYRAKHSRAPIWNGKDWKNLKAILGEHNPQALPLDRLKLLWGNFSCSTEAFTVKQGNSLAYFCSNLDKFSDGPILAAKSGGSNGSNWKRPGSDTTQDHIDRIARNAQVLGLDRS